MKDMMNYARVQSKERKAVFFATITGKNITLCILAAKTYRGQYTSD
jgi:hypothetical protein